MFLSIFVLPIVYLCLCICAEQCPSSKYCRCSKDLTSVTCAHRHLTDQLLNTLQSQLPSSTVVLNLSSNSLTSINVLSNLNNLQTLDVSSNRIRTLPSNLFGKLPQLVSLHLQHNLLKMVPKSFNEISNINLDLSNNPLSCQCSMKWMVKWFETIELLKPIHCQRHDRLTDDDFCARRHDSLQIYPSQSQIVYENDSFHLNCSSTDKHFWTLNGQFYSNESTLFISTLNANHTGLWTCHTADRNRSISLHVFQVRAHHFCPSIQMDTSKGHFYWTRTLTGHTLELTCPFESAAWLNGTVEHAKAFYTCSSNRQWIDLDLSRCAFRSNISREFDRLLSNNESNLLSKLVTYISKVDLEQFQFDDIIFLIDLIDEEQEKYRTFQRTVDEISMFIYRLTDYILQIERRFVHHVQYQSALTRLRSIVEQLLDQANRSWLYVGKQLTAMTLELPLPPTICFIPNRPLLTIICGIVNRQYKRHEVRSTCIVDSLRDSCYLSSHDWPLYSSFCRRIRLVINRRLSTVSLSTVNRHCSRSMATTIAIP
jgi:Leucine-rich repeat (LRR) protein